jgi:hypothetical protein
MFPCNTKVSLLSCVFTTHSVFFFFISTGVSSGLNGSRAAEQRTPQDAEYHIAPTGTEPPFCSCRVSPSLKAAAVFRQGDNVPSFASLPSLSVAYFVLCVCVIWNSNFFFDNIICKSDAGKFRVAL